MKNLYLLILASCFFSMSMAQTGTLRGKLTDENGLGLPGASVFIESLGKGVISDVEGNYVMLNIEAGQHDLLVEFIGYADFSSTVDISAGQTTIFNAELAPGITIGEEVLVLGDRLKGQAKALNQQKNNVNITNIVAADQIGRFPDANIGDAIKRVSGITIQTDQGEARNIIVRGLSPQLNSVTLNGDRIPSAEGDNRNIQLDLIPADMVQTIEVNKAVTPDMDGDAIGGSVNLITRPAPNGLRVSATLGSGMNFITNKPTFVGSFIVGTRFAEDRIGLIVSSSLNYQDFGSDNVEAEWTNEAESPLTGEDISVDPYIGEHDIRTYLVRRFRRSFQAAMDFKLDDNNTITINGIYNWRDDWENRYRVRIRSIDPIFADGTENIIGFTGEQRRQTKGGIGTGRINNRRLEDQRAQVYGINGDHLFGNIRLNWKASYAKAAEDRPNERYIRYEQGDAFTLRHDISDPMFPVVTAADPADIAPGNFQFDEITEENQFTQEEDINAKIDLEIPVNVNNFDGSIKFGTRARIKTKERINNFFEISPLGSELDLLSGVPQIDVTDPNYLAGSEYTAGIFVDPDYLGSLDFNNANLFEIEDAPSEYLPVNYTADENIFAGYVMWSQRLADAFDFIAGVRVEATDLEYTGNVLEDSEDLIAEVTSTDNYVNVLPSLHLRYQLGDRTFLRAAYTNTLARPNYFDLVPYQDVIPDDEEVFRGNPELDPTTSMNIDLLADHYFTSVGLVSGGVFYKKVDDFIYVQTTIDENGFNLFQPQNGGSANIFGFEAAFQRQLDFLPGIWKGFGVYFNYTFLSSSADGVRNGDGDLREGLELPGTASHMVNGSLSYENEKLVLRMSLNFSDDYIDEVGDSEFNDRYYDRQLFLDFNGSYAITPALRVFAEVNNLTNQPLRYYQGVRDRTMQVEFYDRRFTLGLKYDLFQK